MLSFSISIHPRHIWRELVYSFSVTQLMSLSWLFSPVSMEKIFLLLEVIHLLFLVVWLVRMVIDVCVSVMWSDFICCLLVIVSGSIKFLTFSVKWLKRLAVKLIKFWLRRDMSLMSYSLVMLHGRFRIWQGHSCWVSWELIVLLDLGPISIDSPWFLPCLIHCFLISKYVRILVWSSYCLSSVRALSDWSTSIWSSIATSIENVCEIFSTL